MPTELKVKTKHLAAEARIIKHEERKLKQRQKKSPHPRRQALRRALREHRIEVVRPHARSTHLAYGFLRGTRYRAIEDDRTRSTPNWPEIERMILKYGEADSRTLKQAFAEWKSEN